MWKKEKNDNKIEHYISHRFAGHFGDSIERL